MHAHNKFRFWKFQSDPTKSSWFFLLIHTTSLLLHPSVCLCVCVHVCMCACACMCVPYVPRVIGVTLKKEMRKWGNGKKGTLHFTQQTADVLLLQSSNVMRKSISISIHIPEHLGTKGQHTQGHCITVHKLALCIIMYLVTFGSIILTFLWICKLFTLCSNFLQRVFLELLLHCYVYLSHITYNSMY